MKGAEKDTIKDIKAAGKEDKSTTYDNSELMSAIKGVSLTPASSGLNARAAAGVDIAHQVLEKSSAMNPLGVYVRTAMDPLKDKGTLTEAVDKDVEKMKL